MSEPWSGLGTGVLRDAAPGREGGGADGEAELVVLRVLEVLVSPQQDVGQAGLARPGGSQDDEPGAGVPGGVVRGHSRARGGEGGEVPSRRNS